MEQTSQAPAKAANTEALVRELSAAGKRLALYPPGHPAATKAAERPFELLRLLWEREPQVIISLAEGKLVGDGMPLDSRYLADGLGRAMLDGNIQSVSFQPQLEREDFEAFLGHLNEKPEARDLIGFLKEKRIAGIEIDKWHYELVGDDEKVVAADAVEVESGGGSTLRVTLSDMIREHPGVIVSLLSKHNASGTAGGIDPAARKLVGEYLAGKQGGGTGSGGGSGEGTGAGEGQGGGGHGPGSGGGGEPQHSVPDPSVVLKELDELSDEELVLLLVAGLRESVTDEDLKSQFNAAQALLSIKEMLVQKDDPALMHSLRQALTQAGVVEQRYLDLIFNDEASTEEIACEEAERFLELYKSGEPESSMAADLVAWMQRIENKGYISSFVSRFFELLNTADFQLNSAQQGTLAYLLELLNGEPKSTLAIEFRTEVLRRIQDPAISLSEMRLISRVTEHFYATAISHQDHETAAKLLHAINHIALGKQVHADGVAGCAWDLRHKLCSPKAVQEITDGLKDNFAAHGRAAFELLAQFGGQEAALAFAGCLVHPERGVRLMVIRLLSAMGEEAVKAMRVELESSELSGRHTEEPQVPDMIWYRLRNIVLVLGNTGHPDAVELLEPLSDYRDERVAEEVIIALEKLNWDDATRILAKMLSHPARRVHTRAVRALAGRKADIALPLVENYFVRHPSERQTVLPVLAGIDKNRAVTFLREVLTGESEAYSRLYSKPDESLNELIVKTFISWRSPVTVDALRRYVKGATRSLLSQLRKPASVKLAEKCLRSLERRS